VNNPNVAPPSAPENVPGPIDPPAISPAPIADNASPVRVVLSLPAHVYQAYAIDARAQQKDPETFLTERLLRCQTHNDAGMWFTAQQKRQFETFLGRGVADGQSAIQWLTPLKGIDVSGIKIELSPRTLDRLKSRVRRGGTLKKLIETEVVKSLRQYAGELPY
jgi:hypothetical protein